MTDLISIGSSGLRAYQSALGTTSDNIANAQTAGYVRRTIQLQEAAPGANSPLYRAATAPGGVIVGGVQRSIDQWLVEDARTSTGDAERASVKLDWLNATERAINDGPNGVGSATTAVFNAADNLAADPTNNAARTAFLQAVSGASDTIRGTADKLASVSNGVAAVASDNVSQLNSNLVALQRINSSLLRSRDGSTSQASLLDDRDRLLDQLSAMVPIKASFDSHGAVSVTLQGSNPASLLSGPQIATFSVSMGADARLAFSVDGTLVQPGSGALAGLTSAADHIATQRSGLDQLATQFASQLNAAHESGFDANGKPGLPLVDISAGASTLFANTLNPSQVAAADAASDNGNMLSFAGLRGAGGVEQGWAQLAAAQAQTVSTAKAEDAAASSRRDGATQARSELSSVDLDREAAELMRFQQAYQASARVIQVARDTFQSILSAI